MRISDWSSDVCSSDLAGNPPKEWIDSGYMLRADSIEELAEKCGIPVATLRATIKRFNGFATSGVDADFHRGERSEERRVGKECVVRVDIGGRRIIKKKNREIYERLETY